MQALERSRSKPSAVNTPEKPEVRKPAAAAPGGDPLDPGLTQEGPSERPSEQALKDARVVAFDPQDPLTRTFDLLRNRVLGEMPATGSHVIAVAAPTTGCGVSVTAANLAFSVARLRNSTVVLADMNVPSPMAGHLAFRDTRSGHNPAAGLRRVEAGGCSVLTSPAGELLLSLRRQASLPALASAWLTQVKRAFEPVVVILDLPPLLHGDDGMPIAVNADAVALVLGVGKSTVADLDACRSSLPESRCHVVLNKARRHGL